MNVSLLEKLFKSLTTKSFLIRFRLFSKLWLNFSSRKRKLLFLFFLLWKLRFFARNKSFLYFDKFAKVSLVCDKNRDFVALFDSFFDFVNSVISIITKYDFAKSVTINVNRFSVSALTIFKIFRIFRKKISPSSVKTLDKQKIFAFAFVRFVRFVRIESSISNLSEIAIFFDRFFEFATFSNFSSRFFVDLFFEMAMFFDFSFATFFDLLFFFDSLSSDFREFFSLRRFCEFVDYRFLKIFQLI